MRELGFELPSDDGNLTLVLLCLQCQKFLIELQLTVNSDYISIPFQKYREEIKLRLITLQKSTHSVSGQSRPCQKSTHMVPRNMFPAAAL